MTLSRNLTSAFCCLLVVLAVSCQQELYKGRNTSGNVIREKPLGTADIRHAKGFTITYYKNFKQVNIFTRTATATDTVQYLLIKRGGAIPDGFPDAHIIETPVKSLIGMSSLHVALIDFAEADAVLTGLGSLKYASAPAVRKYISEGKIKEIGAEGNWNIEQILTMHPDVVMAVGYMNAKANNYKILTDAGIPVMRNTEFLESTPLGRAEWVKLMGALVDKEATVNKKFDKVESEYNSLVKLAGQAGIKPHVITGMPIKGTWYVPEGNSYLTHFLQDAGATSKWADVKGIGSLPLSFEVVAPEALKADFWLNIGYVDSRQEVLGKDSRFGDFKPFKNGNLYNHNKKTNEVGANDYWESGAVNPQLVLADLIKILHPELLPGHKLLYYKQLK